MEAAKSSSDADNDGWSSNMSSMATSIDSAVGISSGDGVVLMRSVFQVKFLDGCVYSKDDSANTELMRRSSAQPRLYSLVFLLLTMTMRRGIEGCRKTMR